MSSLQAKCPSCAAAIEFQKGSTIVLICPFCRSAVARTDRGLEDLGKVAEIAESESPLRIGLSGVWRGQRFELTGRIRKLHELGGSWDEWYAVFSSGKVGWLAEAQGKFSLTFYHEISPDIPLVSFDKLELGQEVDQISDAKPLIVAEKGTATAISAEGEIPFKFIPEERSDYADLSGESDVFGTIDYGKDPPQVLLGKLLSLEEIGLSEAAPKVAEARSVPTTSIGCPNCAAPLELTAPDRSLRVTCPFCESLLDVSDGDLSFLNSLKTEQTFKFDLPIGAEVSFENFSGGATFKLIGALVRSVYFDQKYFWNEYLLYNPNIGFRWLVHSDGHWNFVEPVNVADVKEAEDTDSIVTFQSRAFRIFQEATATVEYVTGEFYWRVTQGEKVRATDYVAPPLMLSKEVAEKEINYSLGTFLKNEEVEKAFNVPPFEELNFIAPNQPFRHNALIRASLIVLLGAIVVFAFVGLLSKPANTAQIFEQGFMLSPKTSAEEKTIIYSSPILIDQALYRSLSISANIGYESWSEFDVSLVPADVEHNMNDTAQVKDSQPPFRDMEFGYVEQTKLQQLKETGEYQIRADGKWKNWENPLTVRLALSQFKRQSISLEFGLIVLFIIPPLLFLPYKSFFESRRWQNANMPRPNFLERMFGGVLSGK